MTGGDFATGAWCPITDLEHADMAYEWNWGANLLSGGSVVDQTISKALSSAYGDYLACATKKVPVRASTVTSPRNSIRLGTKDSDTALTVASNLAARLKNLGDDVDTSYYWDAGHGADNDPGDFVKWIATVSGYRS
ncbi:hypothetical protein [Streptomyces mirabilis]